jgi:uncharacterized protein YejL (UPF0352 family)
VGGFGANIDFHLYLDKQIEEVLTTMDKHKAEDPKSDYKCIPFLFAVTKAFPKFDSKPYSIGLKAATSAWSKHSNEMSLSFMLLANMLDGWDNSIKKMS